MRSVRRRGFRRVVSSFRLRVLPAEEERVETEIPAREWYTHIYTPFGKQLINQLQVSEAKPKHYWLGRFVTLTNAFHYEDSFSEPDVATGFGMLSSYSFPAKDDADRPGYRVRRAFMVLENVCVTEEASWSFRRFRDEYVARYGRWIGY